MGSTAAGLTHQIWREVEAYLETIDEEEYADNDHTVKWEEVPLTQMENAVDGDTMVVGEGSKDKPHTLKHKALKFLKIILPHVGLTTILLLYVAIGAAVFQLLEAREEIQSREDRFNHITTVYETIMNETWQRCQNLPVSKAEWNLIIRGHLQNLSKLHEHSNRGPSQEEGFSFNDSDIQTRWTFQASVLYTLTVLTTTGYDHVTPQTSAGKLFAVFFGLLGIPLMFITAADIGKFLSEIFMKAWAEFVRLRRSLWNKFRGRRYRRNVGKSKDLLNATGVLAPVDNPTEHIELPVFAYFGLILGYCAVGGLLHTSWENAPYWTFLHAFHFSFNTITTIGLGNIMVTNMLYMLLIVTYVIIGLAVVTMCVDLASSQLKLLFSKIHYFGRKMRGARDAFANMSDDLKEAMRVIAAIRRNRPHKAQITVEDIRKYLELEAQGLQRPFIPHNIHFIRFVDEEELSSVLSGSGISINLARVNSDPNLHI